MQDPMNLTLPFLLWSTSPSITVHPDEMSLNLMSADQDVVEKTSPTNDSDIETSKDFMGHDVIWLLKFSGTV